MFYLVRLEPDGDGFKEVPLPDYGPYLEGPAAAKQAKELAAKFGVKVQPRRMSQAPDWRAAFAQKLADGTLKPLPAKWDLDPIKDHFAHLHAVDNSQIGFVEDEQKGVIGRVTGLNPGRYLHRFYPQLGEEDCKRYIALIDVGEGLQFAWTPEDIVRVYETGPSSCMGKRKDEEWEDHPVHPVHVYGAGDLAVAFFKNASKRIAGRVLTWPARKVYGRIYGDSARMKKLLEDEGYTYASTFPEGAKLLAIPHDEGGYVSPYFDNLTYAVQVGEHFVTKTEVRKGDVHISSGGTGGRSLLLRWCPKLEGFADADRFVLVSGVDQEWSSTSLQRYGFMCPGTKKAWPIDNRWSVEMYNGVRWSKEHFEANGFRCDQSGENYPLTDAVTLDDGRRVHRAYATRAAKRSKPPTQLERDSSRLVADVVF